MVEIIVSFFIALLSGMGVGSAGLMVIYLTAFSSVPQLTAQGINLLFYIFSSGSSMIVHSSRRRFYPKYALWMICAAVPGIIAGTYLSSVISEALIRKCFGVMLVTAGTITILRTFRIPKGLKDKDHSNESRT